MAREWQPKAFIATLERVLGVPEKPDWPNRLGVSRTDLRILRDPPVGILAPHPYALCPHRSEVRRLEKALGVSSKAEGWIEMNPDVVNRKVERQCTVTRAKPVGPLGDQYRSGDPDAMRECMRAFQEAGEHTWIFADGQEIRVLHDGIEFLMLDEAGRGAYKRAFEQHGFEFVARKRTRIRKFRRKEFWLEPT